MVLDPKIVNLGIFKTVLNSIFDSRINLKPISLSSPLKSKITFGFDSTSSFPTTINVMLPMHTHTHAHTHYEHTHTL